MTDTKRGHAAGRCRIGPGAKSGGGEVLARLAMAHKARNMERPTK
jgi:hypothetical protein